MERPDQDCPAPPTVSSRQGTREILTRNTVRDSLALPTGLALPKPPYDACRLAGIRMGDSDETLDQAPTVEQPAQRPATDRPPSASPGDITWTGSSAETNRDGTDEAVHKHDTSTDTSERRGFGERAMLAGGAVMAVLGLAAAVFGLQALLSANRLDAEAADREAEYAKVDAERMDLAEEALTQVFSVIDVTDAVSGVLEAGNAYRQAADHVIEVTNQAVALEDEGKATEAQALMADEGAKAFAAAAEAKQRFQESLTRLQELAA